MLTATQLMAQQQYQIKYSYNSDNKISYNRILLLSIIMIIVSINSVMECAFAIIKLLKIQETTVVKAQCPYIYIYIYISLTLESQEFIYG